MKKNFVFAAVLAVVVFVVGGIAQDTKADKKAAADFSGTWTLDLAKSDLGPATGMIKSSTLTIAQSGASFKVTTATERIPPPEGAGGGARPAGPGGAGGGRGMPAGPQEQSYTLDGKETSVERQTPNGAVSIKTRAEQVGNKIRISTTSPGPDGEVTRTTGYELSADGKTLTVVRPGAQGAVAKWVYNKS